MIFYSKAIFDEVYLIYANNIVQLIALIYLTVWVFWELLDILNINMFTITEWQKEAK